MQPFKYLLERDKRKGKVKPAGISLCDHKVFDKPTRTERQCLHTASIAVRDVKTGKVLNVLCRLHANRGLPYGDAVFTKLEKGER